MISGRAVGKAWEKGEARDENQLWRRAFDREVIDVVEEGNRLIQFTYEGFLRKSGSAWTDATAAVYYPSAGG